MADNGGGQTDDSAGSQKSVPPVAAAIPFMPDGLDYGVVQKELDGQTERGAAILAGAFLEWRLRDAIKNRFVQWQATRPGRTTPEGVGELLLGSDARVPKLGFGDQCVLAYCMGIIGPAQYFDMKTLAKIRNRFAHHMEVSSFQGDKDVCSLCSALETPKHWERVIYALTDTTVNIPFTDVSPKGLFLNTVQMMWIAIYHMGMRHSRGDTTTPHELQCW